MSKTSLGETVFADDIEWALKGEASDIAGAVFDLVPVPLWLQDFSGVKDVLDRCRREGVVSLSDHLKKHPEVSQEAAGSIRLVAVNGKTLEVFEADDLQHLQANLSTVFSGDMFKTHITELIQLWDGHGGFESQGVNYTLSGRRLDVQVKGRIVPGYDGDWSRVLVSTEDVTEREVALRQLERSESFARGLFEHSPISLWVEDFSGIRELIDDVRQRGVEDFRTFLDVHPEFIDRCLSEIHVLDVNRHTIKMFAAEDKSVLLSRLADVFRDDMRPHFKEQLIELWNGVLFQSREVVNYTLEGETLHLHMQFSVFPGHEDDWSLVQVALTDITARKKAETYLEYLGKHDILTKLHNRSFFDDELNRLERRRVAPVTVIVADLNGLKNINDTLGHAAGDSLLRRAGEVLRETVKPPYQVSRVGGDEFIILMPAAGEPEGRHLIAEIEELVDINNQFYSGSTLSFSMGLATARDGERLEEATQRADDAMYEAKRAFYSDPSKERRR
ncbi:sensor domain-containing diguanylate cyclase [Fulvimarina sp. MAC3]|uniref:sensor domain-containing diguanylate cyclase n=1 Tax=Fulvimarina sp. MAC3 TaxID=3148887 RepID=UPI0031FC9C33